MVAGPPVVDASIRDALVAALVAEGCPPEIARELPHQDEVAYAVGHLAMNAAADNAEAVDRTARGESGWTPYWPLAGRSPRR